MLVGENENLTIADQEWTMDAGYFCLDGISSSSPGPRKEFQMRMILLLLIFLLVACSMPGRSEVLELDQWTYIQLDNSRPRYDRRTSGDGYLDVTGGFHPDGESEGNSVGWLETPGYRSDWSHFVPIEVGSGEHDRIDKPISLKLAITELLDKSGIRLDVDKASLRVVEVDAEGNLIDEIVESQFDPGAGFDATSNATGTLTFLLKRVTPKNTIRRYHLLLGSLSGYHVQPLFLKQVTFDDYIQHAGFPSFRFVTSNATYFYHKKGSAFASMIDLDGNDWISYRPDGGPKGSYRGIPNIAPAGFHPGPGEGNKASRIISTGPLRAEVRSETEDGQWACTWEVFPSYASMTLDRKGCDPYWILYEGTPGGRFTVDDYWIDSSGRRYESAPYRLERKWNGDLPEPEWVYFVDPQLDRALFLVHHEYSEEIDEYWHFGDGGMTVFGFGRGPKESGWQRLENVPARFTIGFAETTDFSEVRRIVHSAYEPLEVRIGKASVCGGQSKDG
jgi:hypothetical protein